MNGAQERISQEDGGSEEEGGQLIKRRTQEEPCIFFLIRSLMRPFTVRPGIKTILRKPNCDDYSVNSMGF